MAVATPTSSASQLMLAAGLMLRRDLFQSWETLCGVS